MKAKRSIVLVVLFAMILSVVGCSGAKSTGDKSAPANSSLPSIITWTSYDIGGTAYIQSAAIAGALKQNNNITMRVIPSGTDMARMSPVRNGNAQFACTGGGIYLAFEGQEEFGSAEWGPQDVRMAWGGMSDTGCGLYAKESSGIKTLYDLKGKKSTVCYRSAGYQCPNRSTAGLCQFDLE